VEVADVPVEANAAPLALTPQRVQRDQRVNIIQHPGGHYKKIAMQKNFAAYADARDVYYMTSTEPGSSGSPVFDNDFVVVAIHTGSKPVTDPTTGEFYVRNRGSSMIAVLDDLRDNAPEIYRRLNIL
jgi:V8-like Glu-specific endopeptidase